MYCSQGSVDHVTELNGHVSSVKAVDADEEFAVTASRDRTLKVWSLIELKETNLSGNTTIYLKHMHHKVKNIHMIINMNTINRRPILLYHKLWFTLI